MARFREHWLPSLMIVLVTHLLVDWANPFGVGTAIDAQATRMVQRELATLYGRCPRWRSACDSSSTGQHRVTVVLIDERFAKAISAQEARDPNEKDSIWPLPVSDLMFKVIQPILSERPAALFIDIAFPHAPREITSGVSQIAPVGATGRQSPPLSATGFLGLQLASLDQNNSNPPIFLSDVISPSGDEREKYAKCYTYISRTFLPDRSVMDGELRRQVFGAHRSGRITLVDSDVSSPAGNYRLVPLMTGKEHSCETRKEQLDAFIPSPALALLTAYCALPDAQGCNLPDLPRAGQRDESGFTTYQISPALYDRREMELRWRTDLTKDRLDAYQNSTGTDRCAAQSYQSLFEPAEIYALTVFKPIEDWSHGIVERPCPYIDTVSPDDLDTAIPSADPKATIGSKFITGRIVLLGSAVRQAGDIYESPVNGSIPGVYVHAAAIENLLSSGMAFAPATLGWLMWCVLIVIQIVSVRGFEWLWEKLINILTPAAPPIGELLIAPMIYLVAAFVCSLILLVVLDIGLPKLSWRLALPTTDIALPIIALHGVLFWDWGERIQKRFKDILAGRSMTD